MSNVNKKVSDNLIKFSVVALALGIVFFVSNAAHAAGIPTTDHSIGAWSSLNVASEVLPGYELQLEEQYRYHETNDSQNHTDISIGKRLRNWKGIIGYKNVYGNEHRTYVGVDIGLPNVAGFNTGLTTTFELSNLEDFRQRFGAYAQTDGDGNAFGLAPYISNEVFLNIDTGSNIIDKNRATFGIAKSITDTYAIEAYYNLDTQFIGDDITNISIVGLGLNVSL